VVTGTGTAKDPRTSTRFHLRLLEKNVLEQVLVRSVGVAHIRGKLARDEPRQAC